MEAQSKKFALAAMLDVSISGYRAWKRGCTFDRKRPAADQTLAMIRAIHVELKSDYRSARMGQIFKT